MEDEKDDDIRFKQSIRSRRGKLGKSSDTMFLLIWIAILVLGLFSAWMFGFVIGWLFGRKNTKQVIYLNAIDESWGVKSLSKPKKFSNEGHNGLEENTVIENNLINVEDLKFGFLSKFFSPKKKKEKAIFAPQSKMEIWLNRSILVVFLLMLGYGIFWYTTKYNFRQQENREAQAIESGEKIADRNLKDRDKILDFENIAFDNWTNYDSSELKIKFNYPKNWQVVKGSNYQYQPEATNKDTALSVILDSKDGLKESELKQWDLDLNDENVKKEYQKYKTAVLENNINLRIWNVNNPNKHSTSSFSNLNKPTGQISNRLPMVIGGILVNKYWSSADKLQYFTYYFIDEREPENVVIAQITAPENVNEENKLFFMINKIVRSIKFK